MRSRALSLETEHLSRLIPLSAGRAEGGAVLQVFISVSGESRTTTGGTTRFGRETPPLRFQYYIVSDLLPIGIINDQTSTRCGII